MTVSLALVCILISAHPLDAQDISLTAEERIRRATVLITQIYTLGDNQALSCIGSGTLISDDGLIVTNAHLADTIGPCRGERVIISLSVRDDQPPVPTYIASPVQVNHRSNVAVLAISAGLDGSAVDRAELSLPFVQIGDPSALMAGRMMMYAGFPDTSSGGPEIVSHPVSSIAEDPSGGSQAWHRISAPLPGIMSGGGAYSPAGDLVGILTSSPASTNLVAGPTCLEIQDVNNDGLISSSDACVPVGSSVTAIRSLAFAMGSIEAARRGLSASYTPGLPMSQSTSSPFSDHQFFSTGLSDSGVPSGIVTALESGASKVYFFFDYANMSVGMPYEVVVLKDGTVVPELSIGPLPWAGKASGTWYLGNQTFVWLEGYYEFQIIVNGIQVAARGLTVETLEPSEPKLSNLMFSVPGGSTQGRIFPAEVTQINATFEFDGMQDGQTWTEVWYLDKVEVSRITRTWDNGQDGQLTVNATNLEGLPAGNYRLDIFLEDRLVASGDVVLAGLVSQTGDAQVFSNSRVASDISLDGLPSGTVGDVMPLGTSRIIAFVDWDFMPQGTDWTYRWFLDGRLVASSSQVWGAGGVGKDFWISLESPGALVEGTYSVEVLVESRPMFSKSVTIGSGNAPEAAVELDGDEVFISGTVLDAVTDEGIPNALIIVLEVEFESAQFEYDESQILTQAISDQNGRFSLPVGLPRGAFYTVYVFADGYITVLEDVFWVFRDQVSPAEISIKMGRP